MHPETQLECISKGNSLTLIVKNKLTELLAKKISNLSIHAEGAHSMALYSYADDMVRVCVKPRSIQDPLTRK